MNTIKTMEKILLAMLLVFVLGGCSSKQTLSETLQTQSRQEVHYQAPLQAESYRWTQLSGVEVALPEPESQTLRFIAPVVTQEEVLLFELEAKSGERVQRLQVEVIVTPVASDTEDNTSTGGGSDDNTSTGGGTDDNSSTGGGSDDDNATGGSDDSNSTTVTLKALSLALADTTLNKDHNTTLTLTATYSDHTTKPLTGGITWIITPSDAVTLHGTTLTAHKDTNVTVQAKVGTTLSNAVSLNVYWEVNGHRLPPEPDPAVNNSTLLGVDVNGNDVRDDVERWIYEKYKEKHPIHIDIAMQAARGYRLVLETPEKAKEIHRKVSAAMSCESYYQIYAKYFNEPILVNGDIDTKYFRETIYFNTKERKDAYIKYDTLLSGDTYALPRLKEKKSLCDFNTSKYEE